MLFFRLKSILTIFLMFSSSHFSQVSSFYEDFEEYEVGSFPSLNWGDIVDISIPVTAPTPSSQIIETIGYDGNPTKALQYADAVSTSGGIFREIDTEQELRVTAKLRIDRWSNSTRAFFTDWTVLLGFHTIRSGWDNNAVPQITFLVQPVNENWVLYALRSDANPNNFYNKEFPVKVKLDTWYHVEFSVNKETGEVYTKVIDLSTGNVDLEESTPIPGWRGPSSFNYTHFGSWDGEYNTNATVGNLATVDDIRFGDEITDVDESSINLSDNFQLFQNYPNPFNPSTNISYKIPEQNDVKLSVFDLLGNELFVLEDEQKSAGIHSVQFDATQLSSGVYFYEIIAGRTRESKKMVVLK